MNPAEPLVFDYISPSGSIGAVLEYAKSHGNLVVLKPLKGTGGNDVYRASTPKEIECAVLNIWRKDYGLAVSPYIVIVREIRVVVLHGEARLTYSKQRQVVVGDGIQSVTELLATLMTKSSNPRVIAERIANATPAELRSVPAVGQEVLIEWRHNLGRGADIDFVDSPEASALAVSAAAALTMKFCSVDIVELTDGSLSVLEVNSGVMMDAFLSSSDECRAIAKSVYRDAILRALE